MIGENILHYTHSSDIASIIITDNATIEITENTNCILRISETIKNVHITVRAHAAVKLYYDNKSELINGEQNIIIYAHEKSIVHCYALYTGACRSTVKITTHTVGADAQIEYHALLLGTDSANVEFKLQQMHESAGAQSIFSIRSVLTDNAKCLHTGVIDIARDASQSVASQHSTHLLLGEQSSAYGMPCLQVRNNEVKCKHGAAVGRLDREHVEYLCARGFDEADAYQLLLHAQCALVIDQLPEDMRQRAQYFLAYLLKRK